MALEERDFDVIVVGCGCAGAIAAYVAAKKGKSVLVVERGEYAGAKNMTGGRIYAHSLRAVFDEYADGEVDWDEIPFERKITHERIAMMDPASNMTIDYTSENLGEAGQESYSVLRGEFDQWLMGLVEEGGCEIIPGIAVEALLKDEGGCVTGIRAGEDEITAHVVIVAEGQNSLLAERFLGAPRPKANQMAVGIKEVFELDEKTIEDRFLTPEGEGAAMLFVGDCTHGVVGGGFMYANKTSVSLGLVSTISEMEKADTTIYQAMEDFKNHPAVAPIIRGAEMVEHSGHMVSEGGAEMVSELVHDGALVAGDAAMLCMNLGYMVRGMDLAVASGRFAAEAACEAIDAENVSRAGLAGYKTRMDGSFVMKDLRTFAKWPHTMETWERMFTDYPKMVGEIFDSMFVVDGTPQQPLRKRIMPIVKQRGLFKLAKEVKGALSAL
ncbi:Electron transfer flavoprotein-ubiquinone oxidoreductase [Slackia heliotrinireducens]|uniref:Flavin-dependent dehydrogenase n=1 Tax=Slackia heliotrinireducens (strain ATCC 29202 / DSM 20476 / NCTC 11029 / RHS 1) TaxID=471855 RepID=C7N437_SLAHD|nr:FAD-dependent oxidoreductase [Slackia heliotrinireducens]ACV23773.1 flavin-dependent dehydrogenase [Slackia heliotrinireducens DSM 20476]VEH03417.1 Electron transfer flavoprotein-ubiquinone oxidoreductase [Slackia heliotrinireducens]